MHAKKNDLLPGVPTNLIQQRAHHDEPPRALATHQGILGIVEILRSSAEAVTGRGVPLEGVPFGADSGLLSQVAGTPTVLFGAGDIRLAHRPDEYVYIGDLVRMAKALATAAIRFCGTP